MLTYFFLAVVIVAVVFAIAQVRQSRRDGEQLGADPPEPDVDLNLFVDTSNSPHHDSPAPGGCDNGGHDAGGFDCGSHGGFDGGAHH